MKRAGALLGVVVMVAAAFLVRGALTDDDPSIAGGPSGTDGVRCPDEFADLCAGSGLEIVTASAGTTADLLVAADDVGALDAEAWIVPAAWARLVIDERARLGRAPLFEIDGDPLASTGVVMAIWSDRDAELAARCADIDWRCLAEQHGVTLAAGDRVRSAGPRIDTAGGLSIAAAQLATLIGTTEYAANDFDGTILSLADRLAQGQTDDPLRTMRGRGPGQLTAAGVLTADATNLSSSLGTIIPRVDDAVRVDLVALVATGDGLTDDHRNALRDAFSTAGWDQPAGSAGDGLPDGSVLAAVRTLWKQAA